MPHRHISPGETDALRIDDLTVELAIFAKRHVQRGWRRCRRERNNHRCILSGLGTVSPSRLRHADTDACQRDSSPLEPQDDFHRVNQL